MFHSIRWRIAITFVALILICIGGLSAYLLQFVKTDYVDNLRMQLITQAQLIADASQPYLESEQIEDINNLTRRLGEKTDARITIIDNDGVVLSDSEENPGTMENHGSRPEIIDALSIGMGNSIRYSTTLNCDMMYVAVPISAEGTTYGIARVSIPLSEINESLKHMKQRIVIGTIIAALIAILVALEISRATTRPLKELTRMSRKMSHGELDQKIQVTSRDEIGGLAEAFNTMTTRIKEMVTLLTNERDKMATILSSMSDGIFIIDDKSQVTMINRVAEEMFSLSSDEASGRSFIEVVRDHEMDEVLQQCLKTGKQQTKLVQTKPGKQLLGVIATPMESEAGCLVLFQDLTELRRLETVRSDFISNISHELRTPIASLKILAETLQEGAIDDASVAQEFLHKMNTETDRLAQMVNELGELSRIESGEVSLKPEAIDLFEVLSRSAERLRAQAERGEVKLELDVSSDLPKAKADKEQAEQVLVNLIHNAIKFTPPKGKITLSAKEENENILVTVADTGVGIPTDDLPRIFERFYKADKARAGGGTGLGLAIARHIIEAHGGRIWAESIEGKGATFNFTLPAADKP